MIRGLLSAVLAVATLGGCGGSYVIDTEQELLLLTNLRPNRRGHMTSVLNWRGSTVLPACTKVRLTNVGSREIRFVDASNGQEYRYILHRSARAGIEEHVQRYFGQSCPNLSAYSAIDQQGIQQGAVLPGMSREAVVIAVGYPPEHRTPTLEQPTWTYWGHAGPVEVSFQGDVVAAINDPSQTQAQPTQVAVQPQPAPVQTTVQGTVTVGPDGYPVQQTSGSVTVQGTQTSGSVTVQGGYPTQTTQTTTTVVAPAPQPAPATVTVRTNDSRRARRRRRRRRAAVGVTVGVGVAAGAAAANRSDPPRTRTVSRRRSTTRTSGCQTLTINGTRYSDNHGTPMGQSCSQSACPASYVCAGPLDVCVPQEGERCTD